jgi:hypothetical protein
LDTLAGLGCEIIVEKQREESLGYSHYQAAQSNYPIIINLDDDAVVLPIGGFDMLAEAALEHNWVVPIIRFAQNFTNNTIPGHQELWEATHRNDPRIKKVIAEKGEGWLRVFDIGEWTPTKWLGGTCFTVTTQRYLGIAEKLKPMKYGGYADAVVGLSLGEGITHPRVFAYHFGEFSSDKWHWHKVMMKALEGNLENMIEAAQ